ETDDGPLLHAIRTFHPGLGDRARHLHRPVHGGEARRRGRSGDRGQPQPPSHQRQRDGRGGGGRARARFRAGEGGRCGRTRAYGLRAVRGIERAEGTRDPAEERHWLTAVTGRARFLPFLAAILVFPPGTGAAFAAEPVPAISIIIDDIGYRHVEDRRALQLPGAVALSILPHSPHAAEMAALAAERGKEVLLHLPMEPAAPSMNHFLGPGALLL